MKKLVIGAILGGGLLAGAATQRARMQIVFQEQTNGDYRLYVFGGKPLVCEEKAVTVVQQPDAVNPLVIECRH